MTAFKAALAASVMIVAAAPSVWAKPVKQTNLVSDGFTMTPVTDPNLVNPWGMAYGPNGAFWVSDNGTGLTTLYDGLGATQALVVTIPPAPGGEISAPTGQVFNGSSDFVVTEAGVSGASAFLFASEDGTITGWAPSVDVPKAIIAVDNSKDEAIYKGIAIVPGKSGNLLFVANFHEGKVEIYDSKFKFVEDFRDQGGKGVDAIPSNFAPYNVQVLGGHIFVAYAKQDKHKEDSVSAPGAGYVDEVDSTGKLVKRIASKGALNAPWGLAIAPDAFGRLAGSLLVGNFGDGTINAYAIASGKYLGQLKTRGGAPLSIDGLWGLSQGTGAKNGDPTKIYFTAGPLDEAHGLFGTIGFTP